MNIKTWKKEFYSPISKTTKETALDHSIKKWEGLSQENLKKHQLVHDRHTLRDKDGHEFSIDAGTCSLCKHFGGSYLSCTACPIYIVKGRTCQREYSHYYFINDNNPMINLLLEVKKGTKK